MNKSELVKESKKNVTNILADIDRENNILEYQRNLASAYTNFATIKISMNIFTMLEMIEDIKDERKAEIDGFFKSIESIIISSFADDFNESSRSESLSAILDIRETIMAKMKVLTSYTDAFEIYEYILNRREASINGMDESYNPDIEALANQMFEFVFSENDKVVVNTRIQEFVAQLPVRISRQTFYDIIKNAFAIYRGSEKKSLTDFSKSLKEAALIDKPDGFETEYVNLFNTLSAVKAIDYKNMTIEDYNNVSAMIKDSSDEIESAVSDYMLLTEIINDALIILYTSGFAKNDQNNNKLKNAKLIIKKLAESEDIYKASDEIDGLFACLEGAQEDSYEEASAIAISLQNIMDLDLEKTVSGDLISSQFSSLLKADKLTSSSLFMDLEETNDILVVKDEADDIFIDQTTKEAVKDFSHLFETTTKSEQRSIMAKILSMMPVFFNTQDEIKEYFNVALSNCSDKSELIACESIVHDMMLQE